MPSVLFVCTANQFRSPIAAACFLKQLESANLAGTWRVESAGTWAESGLGPPGMTLGVAAALGLPGLDRHRTRPIGPELLAQFDLVLVMESGHKEALCVEFPSVCGRVHLLSELVDGLAYDIPDPADRGVDPAEVGAILSDLVARGQDKIMILAKSA